MHMAVSVLESDQGHLKNELALALRDKNKAEGVVGVVGSGRRAGRGSVERGAGRREGGRREGEREGMYACTPLHKQAEVCLL